MPAPMMAPTPSSTRSTGPRTLRSPESASACVSMGLVRKIFIILTLQFTPPRPSGVFVTAGCYDGRRFDTMYRREFAVARNRELSPALRCLARHFQCCPGTAGAAADEHFPCSCFRWPICASCRRPSRIAETRRRLRGEAMNYLHPLLGVADLHAALDFFCNKLGLVEISRQDNEKRRF